MFGKNLENMVLKRLSELGDDTAVELAKESFEEASKRKAEFEQKRQEILKEMNRGTRRSRGKLPI